MVKISKLLFFIIPLCFLHNEVSSQVFILPHERISVFPNISYFYNQDNKKEFITTICKSDSINIERNIYGFLKQRKIICVSESVYDNENFFISKSLFLLDTKFDIVDTIFKSSNKIDCCNSPPPIIGSNYIIIPLKDKSKPNMIMLLLYHIDTKKKDTIEHTLPNRNDIRVSFGNIVSPNDSSFVFYIKNQVNNYDKGIYIYNIFNKNLIMISEKVSYGQKWSTTLDNTIAFRNKKGIFLNINGVDTNIYPVSSKERIIDINFTPDGKMLHCYYSKGRGMRVKNHHFIINLDGEIVTDDYKYPELKNLGIITYW